MSFFRNSAFFITALLIYGCGSGSQEADTTPIKPVPIHLNTRVFEISNFTTVEPEISVSNDIFFVADGVKNVRFFQKSSTQFEQHIISTEENFRATRLRASNDFLFVKGFENGIGPQLRKYDIKDIENTSLVKTTSVNSAFGGIAFNNGYIYSGGSRGDNIFIYDDQLEYVGQNIVEGPVTDFEISSGVLFASNQTNILSFDILESGQYLQYGGKYPVLSEVIRIETSPSKIYYSDGNYLSILDSTSPHSLNQLYVGNTPFENSYEVPIKYKDNYIFVGYSKTVDIYKIEQDLITKVAWVNTENEVSEIGVSSNYLMVINSPNPVSSLGQSENAGSIEIFELSGLD